MAPHSSTLAWKIPWMEEPGRLQSMGLLGVWKDWATSLSLFTFHFHALGKEMATHSSVLAWRIPGMGEPGGLPSIGSHGVGQDWSDLAAAAAAYLCKMLSYLLQRFLIFFPEVEYLLVLLLFTSCAAAAAANSQLETLHQIFFFPAYKSFTSGTCFHAFCFFTYF